jgi:hypothetical protein
MTLEPRPSEPDAAPAPAPTPDRRRRRTTLTALAATAAAATGVAVAGTFAGAQQDGPTAKPAASTTTSKKPTVRVLVKRGLRGKTGPRGPKGVTGPKGATGPAGATGAAATDVARSLTINWKGAPGANGAATATVPSIGRLDLTCRDDVQELRLTPMRNDLRTVATIDRFQSASVEHERRASTGDPIVVPLPVNGMVTGVLSLEPIGGDGGDGPAPASLTLSSEMKLNAVPGDAGDTNFCYVAAQVLQAGS